MSEQRKKTVKIDLLPDAWQRFERAVDVVAKSAPQHKVRKKPKAKSPKKPKDAK
jgi:hypothetical protein